MRGTIYAKFNIGYKSNFVLKVLNFKELLIVLSLFISSASFIFAKPALSLTNTWIKPFY